MPPSKQEQLAESRSRGQQQGSETTYDTVADTTGPDNDSSPVIQSQPQQTQQSGQKELIVESPKDRLRDEIVASFRQNRQREVEENDDTAELTKFTRSGMPPELEALEEPEAPVEELETQPGDIESNDQVPAPKRKLVVRGKEIEVTEEEFLALAQKAAAADDYLDETKRKLKEADELLRSVKSQAGRDSQNPEHNGGQTNAQDGEGQPPAEGEHHVDPFAKLVETIQFGDPGEAAKSFEQILTIKAQQMTTKQLEEERMRNEAIRSQKILKDFEAQHSDLANDPYAVAAMRTRLVELQTSDLRSLGLDEAQIPKNPDEIAQWHMWYRQKGHGVRDVDVLLKTARDDFMKWKGVVEKPAVKNGAPRVEVQVDRQQRRAAIQQQPSRSVAPKPDSVTQPAPKTDRSSVVQNMIAARSRPRGRVVVQ
jgi:hypothetical protein